MHHRLVLTVRLSVLFLTVVACYSSGSQAGAPATASAAGAGACPQNDKLRMKKEGLHNEEKLTNHIRTLPFEQVLKEEATDESGLYLSSRVISPISPVVVRQDNPAGPQYQEALGYTFLINSVKFPGLTRMDDGRLVLTLNGAIKPGFTEDPSKREEVLLFSEDDGRSWSQPRRFPLDRSVPVNLGGKKMMAYGNHVKAGTAFLFSEDAGQTWSEPEPIRLKLPDGRKVILSDLSYHPLVEGNTATFVGYVSEPGNENDALWKKGELAYSSVLLRYHVDTHTWDVPVLFPIVTGDEGVVTRAQNGDLVAAFRTQLLGVPNPMSDQWEGLSTSRSPDNGKTWSPPAIHNLYGHHHMNFLTLPGGRILMTYAARIGELDGMTYHGVEAVVSHDNGATWDWKHRYILFRWNNQITHSPQSVRLSDGRILTIFLHDTSYSWTDDGHPAERNGVNLVHLGNVSVVIWSP